jgi:FdrA protein
MRNDRPRPNLLQAPLRVVNVGLELFYRSLRDQNVSVVHVDWRPPAGGDERLTGLLDRLSGRKPRD